MLSNCLGLNRRIRLEDMTSSSKDNVDVLLLGSGWTGSFLIPLLKERKVSHAFTSRDGKDGSIRFAFDPESDDAAPYEALPTAKTVLVIFPIYLDGGSKRLLKLYRDTHPDAKQVRWIQLGSTGVWDGGPTLQDEKTKSVFTDRHSPINMTNNRARCEAELLALHSHHDQIAVLNLCGLWGGPRSIRRYVGRIAATKEMLAGKGAIHMMHGIDVARAILAVHQGSKENFGQRWLLTDLRVYDWWDLASKWGDGGEEGRGKPAQGPQLRWVIELMGEHGIKALPRTPEQLGRAMTSLDFWKAIDIPPTMGGVLD